MDDLKEHWRRFCTDLRQDHFLLIYTATERVVWTICWRVLRDEADARDAFQATYTRLLVEARASRSRALDPLALALRFAALEAKALANRRARLARREAASVDEHLEDSESISARTGLGQQQLRALLEREADRLEDDLRLPVELHFFDGMTQREVAEVLGVSVSTINDRLKRALERLRPLLRRAGIERPEDALPLLLPLAILLVPPADLSAAAVFAEARVASAAGGSGAAATATTGSAMALLAKIAAVLMIAVAVTGGVLLLRTNGSAAESQPRQVVAAKPAGERNSSVARPAKLSAPRKADPLPAPKSSLADSPAPRRGPSIDGQLVDELTGQPVPSARIWLARGDFQPVADCTTSADGKFRFANVPPREYSLFVDTPAYRLIDDTGKMVETVDLSDGSDVVGLKLAAWPGDIVTGIARDVTTGLPLAGVTVSARNERLQRARKQLGVAAPLAEAETVTGPDGRYVLTGVFGASYSPPGGVHVEARGIMVRAAKDDYTIRHTSYPQVKAPTMRLVAKKSQREHRLDVYMVPTVPCHVEVVDSSGNEMENVWIYCWPDSMTSHELGDDFRLDGFPARGRMTIPVAPGVEMGIHAKHDGLGYAPVETRFRIDTENAADPIRIVFQPLAEEAIHFRLVNEAGEPIPYYHKVCIEKELPDMGFTCVNALVSNRDDGLVEYGPVDREALEAGKLRLMITGDPRYRELVRPLTVADAAAKDPVILKIPSRPDDLVVSGTIRDADGKPVKGAKITAPALPPVIGLEDGWHSAVTDASGRYTIALPSDVEMLAVRHPDLGATGIRTLRAGDGNDVDWAKANAMVEIHLVDTAGQPITDFSVDTGEEWSQHFVRDVERPGVFFVEQGARPDSIRFQIAVAGQARTDLSVSIPRGRSLVAYRCKLTPNFKGLNATKIELTPLD